MADPVVNHDVLRQRVRQQQDNTEHLVQKIRDIREELFAKASQLQDLSLNLKTQARRNLVNEGASRFIVFANAHLRLSGAITQGLRRMKYTDRVLKIEEIQRVEVQRRDETGKSRAQRKAVNKLTLFSDDAFSEVYGDIVSKESADA